jgi:hypothetical protein
MSVVLFATDREGVPPLVRMLETCLVRGEEGGGYWARCLSRIGEIYIICQQGVTDFAPDSYLVDRSKRGMGKPRVSPTDHLTRRRRSQEEESHQDHHLGRGCLSEGIING